MSESLIELVLEACVEQFGGEILIGYRDGVWRVRSATDGTLLGKGSSLIAACQRAFEGITP
jgi:hypothetical protein